MRFGTARTAGGVDFEWLVIGPFRGPIKGYGLRFRHGLLGVQNGNRFRFVYRLDAGFQA